jgi:hypothetical protein
MLLQYGTTKHKAVRKRKKQAARSAQRAESMRLAAAPATAPPAALLATQYSLVAPEDPALQQRLMRQISSRSQEVLAGPLAALFQHPVRVGVPTLLRETPPTAAAAAAAAAANATEAVVEAVADEDGRRQNGTLPSSNATTLPGLVAANTTTVSANGSLPVPLQVLPSAASAAGRNATRAAANASLATPLQPQSAPSTAVDDEEVVDVSPLAVSGVSAGVCCVCAVHVPRVCWRCTPASHAR